MADSAVRGAAVTPSDTGTIPASSKLYVGVAGNMKVDLLSGDTVTITNAIQGYHYLAVNRVYSTGTTATNIIRFT